ncbi:hypothetical protein LCGC14_2909330 [marine sediment metagenome]|uniref:Uncharacterized protein n=1 Tax=marine sediment metagenome TaxID=412755 RepID=A0A0F8ZZS6_9ZZZZ
MPITTTTLLITGLVATGVSTIISVQQARQQAKTASAIGEFNAQVSKTRAAEKAERLKIAGKARQDELIEQRRIILARNRAKFGKAGVTLEGSPLLVQQETAKNITQDAVMENFNTQIGISAVISRGESEAGLSLLQAKSVKAASRLQVGQALFSGLVQASNIGLNASSTGGGGTKTSSGGTDNKKKKKTDTGGKDE